MSAGRATGPAPAASHGSLATTASSEEVANHALVRPIARIDEGSSSLSLTWVALKGRHRELCSARSARLYFVLSGELRFVLERGAPVVLSAEQYLVVPRGCRYSLDGAGTYLVANTPAFEPGDDVYDDVDGERGRERDDGPVRAEAREPAARSGGEAVGAEGTELDGR